MLEFPAILEINLGTAHCVCSYISTPSMCLNEVMLHGNWLHEVFHLVYVDLLILLESMDVFIVGLQA